MKRFQQTREITRLLELQEQEHRVQLEKMLQAQEQAKQTYQQQLLALNQSLSNLQDKSSPLVLVSTLNHASTVPHPHDMNLGTK